MDVIIAIVSLIGKYASGYDFPTLYFYIYLSYSIMKDIETMLKKKLPDGI
jgi:hypothetical protein